MSETRPPRSSGSPAKLVCEDLVVRYRSTDRPVLDGFSARIASGSLTCVIGPNGCGKTTLLRTLAGHLTPESGQVRIDGRPLSAMRPRDVARSLSILFQENSAPAGLTVEALVRQGRYPHLRFLEAPSAVDLEVVERAFALAGTESLRNRRIDLLSGGQRQLAWITMMLAQEARILLLDEPTTFLDMGHQLLVMGVVERLSAERGITVVAVMHDVNLAARFAGDLLLLRDGTLIASGAPADVLTPARMLRAYGTTGHVVEDPVTGVSLFVPDGPSEDAAKEAP